MTTKLLLPLVTLVLGLGLGHLWSDHSASATTDAKGGSAPSQVSAASNGGQGRKKQGSISLAELEATGETYSNKVKRLTTGVGKAEIEAELRKLAANSTGESARSLKAELIRAWARLDPDSAWKYAVEQTKPLERQRLVEAVAGELAKTNPMEAIQRTLGLASPALKKSAMRKVFEDWSEVDPRAAIGYWNGHPELPSEVSGMGIMFSNISRTDPALAAELALNFRTTSMLPYELTGVMRTWVEKDPGAAVRWAEGQTDPSLRDKTLAAAAQGLMNIDPKLAWETAAKLGSAGAAKELTGKLVGQWMDLDPASAMAYFAGLPEADAKSMSSSIGFVLGGMSPSDQRQLVDQLPDGETKSSILSNLVRSDSQAGRYTDSIGLLNAMPEGRQRDQSLHGLVNEWASKDPGATWKWIQQQPDSSDRDLAAAAYAANLASSDPQAALKMVLDIPDKVMQKGALRNVYSTWARVDSAAANAWLDAQSTFTDSDKKMTRQFAAIGIRASFLSAPTIGNRR